MLASAAAHTTGVCRRTHDWPTASTAEKPLEVETLVQASIDLVPAGPLATRRGEIDVVKRREQQPDQTAGPRHRTSSRAPRLRSRHTPPHTQEQLPTTKLRPNFAQGPRAAPGEAPPPSDSGHLAAEATEGSTYGTPPTQKVNVDTKPS